MSAFNMLSPYIPELAGVKFDAEFDFDITDSSIVSKYTTDAGYQVSNGIVPEAINIKMSFGVGSKSVSGLLSDPLSYAPGLATGALSNVIGSGTVSYLTSRIDFSPTESDYRTGKVYAELQKVKALAKPFDLVIHKFGIIRTVVIKSLNPKRNGRSGDAVYFSVSMQQIFIRGQVRTIDPANKKENSGIAKVTDETI